LVCWSVCTLFVHCRLCLLVDLSVCFLHPVCSLLLVCWMAGRMGGGWIRANHFSRARARPSFLHAFVCPSLPLANSSSPGSRQSTSQSAGCDPFHPLPPSSKHRGSHPDKRVRHAKERIRLSRASAPLLAVLCPVPKMPIPGCALLGGACLLILQSPSTIHNPQSTSSQHPS